MSYDVRSKTCSRIVRLSWGQDILLQASSRVSYLDFRCPRQINLPTGVWRSMVRRRLLRQTKHGWEITEEGRTLVLEGYLIRTKRKEKDPMDGKLPRYRVCRTIGGWAVIDTSITKIKMHNDVVERFHARDAARMKARELNLLDALEKQTSGDAA